MNNDLYNLNQRITAGISNLYMSNASNVTFNSTISNEFLYNDPWINSIQSHIYVTRISCNFPVFDGLFYFSNHMCVEMLSRPEPEVLEQMLKTYKNSKWVDFKDADKP